MHFISLAERQLSGDFRNSFWNRAGLRIFRTRPSPSSRSCRLRLLTAGLAYGVQRVPARQVFYFFSLTTMRSVAFTSTARIAVLPRAPQTSSPVPWLTSLYSKSSRGDYGDARYPGNCSGELIKDLLRYFQPTLVFDPMSGSGTCRDVCDELSINCCCDDLRFGFDACDPATMPNALQFDFIWAHPPYWRQKVYSADPRDLSHSPTLESFLERYGQFIRNCAGLLAPRGRFAILMGNYSDREAGFVDLVYETKRLARESGLRQNTTDIIRFSHGASSGKKIYKSSFIPGLHDVCMVFEKERFPCS